jgi:hypothetical protein
MRKTVFILAGAAAAALAALPLAATAHDTKRVVISERMQFVPPNQQTGTWVGTGAINDAGNATATFSLTPKRNDRQILTGTHVLTSSKGTISVHTRAQVHSSSPAAPPRSFAVGRWRITSATGAYAGMKGRGRVLATADFSTGAITIVRDGHVNDRD